MRRTKIRGVNGLRAFRHRWNGSQILNLLKEYGRIFINWLIGVGKSHNIDEVIEEAVRHGPYDVLVALFPTRRLIRERRWVKNPPKGVTIAILKPRPQKACGRQLNREWRSYERKGLGLLGRDDLCKARCHNYAACFWPQQYGKGLSNLR
jgi:hypothetical protein